MLNRRELLALATLGPMTAAFAADATAEALSALERRGGGRLGVAALDTGSGRRLAWRAQERFPMCSTFKLLLVGAILHHVDSGREKLARRVSYSDADLLEWAPVTRAHLHEGGLSVEALCAAAIQQSDNTAANLLLAGSGGPAGLTRYARALGDATTRLDRAEPDLNSAAPGDPRDTTSPAAMLEDVRALLLGAALSSDSRRLLTSWLVSVETGLTLLRAGLPTGWRAGDKTGRGAHGTINDVAIVWPPQRQPLLLAVYFTASSAAAEVRANVLAETARIVVATLG